MYIIKNIVEDKIIGEFKSDTDFIRFMRKIAIENDDEGSAAFTNVDDAKNYLNNYCSNLTLTNL